ncbi:MAG: hypothetical protein WCO66_00865 [Candidatus Absconditabacteria bacterium]
MKPQLRSYILPLYSKKMIHKGTIKKGETLKLEREYEFGKKGFELVKVVAVFQENGTWCALLTNGMKLYFIPNNK